MDSYEEIWRAARNSARRTAINTAWGHWSALGSLAHGGVRGAPPSIVDPEALVLLSLAYAEDERRLEEMVAWWARVGSPLTSLSRMKAVTMEIGGDGNDYFSTFADLATRSGHRTWRRHAKHTVDTSRAIKHGGPNSLILRGAPALMVRLRAAFGVSAKSDVLSFLIGNRNSVSSVAEITRAVGYTKTAVRASLKDMVTAGLVNETSSHPAAYSTNRRAWQELLQLRSQKVGDEPRWCLWMSIFGFLVGTRELLTPALEGKSNDHVVASKARDLAERYTYVFDYHGIQTPPPAEYPGREFARAFLAICESVADWAGMDG